MLKTKDRKTFPLKAEGVIGSQEDKGHCQSDLPLCFLLPLVAVRVSVSFNQSVSKIKAKRLNSIFSDNIE